MHGFAIYFAAKPSYLRFIVFSDWSPLKMTVGVSILSARFGTVRHLSGAVWHVVWHGSGRIGFVLLSVFQYVCSFVLLFNYVRFCFFEIWILGDCDFLILGCWVIWLLGDLVYCLF